MRLVEFTADSLRFVETPEEAAPGEGFLWIFLEREELPQAWPLLQQAAQHVGGAALLDLHCRDLANATHASYYDYTSIYDLVIFRRLASRHEIAEGLGLESGNGTDDAPKGNGHAVAVRDSTPASATDADAATGKRPIVFDRIHSLAVGFAVYDQLLISVHPKGCHSADDVVRRFLDEVKQGTDSHAARNRLPSSPADLALRMINEMVDRYLEIRKDLGAQLKYWQTELLKTNVRFSDWGAVMEARNQLHALEDLCDEQHDAMQEWLDALREQPLDAFSADEQQAVARRDHLSARARDVVEHIERVLRHAQRLEQTAETAVQIHFSAQGNRTNDIMLVLTTLTAIFLPLNLITGIFGMNFKEMPLLEHNTGFWIAIGTMLLISVSMSLWFWRKRYLSAAD
ncbi:MAG: magnesium transporter CorA family protein [Brachymonas sp.]|nr:magnesium transporter CorA family protein [Brachymonas sp.]